MKSIVVGIALLCFGLNVCAQFISSNLPIVVITTTEHREIIQDVRSLAEMRIIHNLSGRRNFMAEHNDPMKLSYNGFITIEIRGSSSARLAKKQYALSTVTPSLQNRNVSLLGMPGENDWVLNGLAYDGSLIRDYLFFNLSAQLGNYAPRQRYCEVVLNGKYNGLYLLTEKVKVDKNRVNIRKIEKTDNSLPGLSGGYLIVADHQKKGDKNHWTLRSHSGKDVKFFSKWPDDQDITDDQHAYISNYFKRLAYVSKNDDLDTGYPSMIDVPSFIDYMLINELSANGDAYQVSTYYHKDRKGKLRAGPVWDMNITLKAESNQWEFNDGKHVGPTFWGDLFQNKKFKCQLARRWRALTQPGKPLHPDEIIKFIDQTVDTIKEAVIREESRWGSVGLHPAHISNIKSQLLNRVSFISSQLKSAGQCDAFVAPPLVISRINYQSQSAVEEEDVEFVEITNAGNSDVSLKGIYFSGTGFVYQFPKHGVLPPNAVIQISNNSQAFARQHGYVPFGQFDRNLSNTSQRLTLADAFGNVVDEVTYRNTTPWPHVSGNGMHLKLSDLNADNGNPSNWTASSEAIMSTVTVVASEPDIAITVHATPNPTGGDVSVVSSSRIERLTLVSLTGKNIDTQDVNAFQTTISMSNHEAGIYFLFIHAGNRIVVKKIIRN